MHRLSWRSLLAALVISCDSCTNAMCLSFFVTINGKHHHWSSASATSACLPIMFVCFMLACWPVWISPVWTSKPLLSFKISLSKSVGSTLALCLTKCTRICICWASLFSWPGCKNVSLKWCWIVHLHIVVNYTLFKFTNQVLCSLGWREGGIRRGKSC